jgi:hypothetical protein
VISWIGHTLSLTAGVRLSGSSACSSC